MSSRRAAAIGIAVVLAIVVAGEVVAGAESRTEKVLSIGVLPVYPVAPMVPGSTACQAPLGITENFDRVHFNIGTFGRLGPPLIVSVVDHDSQRELGSGRVGPGWVDNGTAQDVHVGTVETGHLVDVCVTNEGPATAYLYGNYYNGKFGTGPLGVTPNNATNGAIVSGIPIDGDIAFTLLRSTPRSLLARIPALFRHAGTFKPRIIGAWTFWLLAALILLGAPLALWLALVRADRPDGGAEDGRYPDSPRS